MMFHKEKKLAFVHPAKTGTHTLIHFLGVIGWKRLPPTHARTERLIKDYPNLMNYQIYGFLRDPLARFESAILHLKRMPTVDQVLLGVLQKNSVTDSLEAVSYDTIVDVFPSLREALPAFCWPQSEWLNHPLVTPLDFDNFEAELRRITGDTTTPIEQRNAATDFGRSVITDKVRAFVREYYAADYALAKDRLGKTYED